MTKRERVTCALNHTTPDKTPHNIELTKEALAAFASYSGIDPKNYFEVAGNHIEKCSYNSGEYITPGFFKDEFGVIWNRSGADKDIGVVEKYLLPEANFDGFVFPKPDIQKAKIDTLAMAENGKDTYKVGKIGMLFFERAWSLRSMEELMCDFYVNQSFAEELFDRILEYNLALVKETLQYDIDGFYFGDDYGMQTDLMFSPEVFERFIKPRLKALFEPIKSAGKTVMLHSCGNISRILPHLIDIGLDVYQTVQPEIYDLKKLKSEFGRDLSFWGGISTQQALPYLKPVQVKELVKNTVEILGENGGYICGPTHQVPNDVPPENIAAMIECL